MNIEWQEGAVCFADGEQWVNEHEYLRKDALITASYAWVHEKDDFQLNTIKQGDYIEASELDTEQKYNDAVEVFRLFWFESRVSYSSFSFYDALFVSSDGAVSSCYNSYLGAERKLTYNQLMAIGELKRKMNERDLVAANKAHSVDFNHSESPKSSKKPKSKEAYRILESMGIEWDEAERKWFKINKQWL